MRLSIILLLAVSAAAQPPIVIPPGRIDPYFQLREYLQLTNDQFTRITRNNNEFNEWVIGKQRRMAQVQEEIAEETACEVLVAGALGIRYAEIEGIRRHIAERRKELSALNQAVLTDAQKVKFKTLEEAIKLDPIINGARAANLLPVEDNCLLFADPRFGTLPTRFCRDQFFPGGIGIFPLPFPGQP
ncbi:MAG: hypothetical protein FJW38_24840 [Acidobacteria bacterium]|nr:hypothetical protein [Acidobacteriota bacterium]